MQLTDIHGPIATDPVLPDDLCDAYGVPRGARRSEVTDVRLDTSAPSVLVRLKRPEGYEDVHPELILQDAGINPAFEPELVPAAADTSALRKLAEAASGGGHHVYTFPRDSNNWQANEDFIAACTRETILSLLDEVDALRSRANAGSRPELVEVLQAVRFDKSFCCLKERNQDDRAALNELRKVLAIGVACAEQHGLPHRSAYALSTVERQR